MKGEKHKYQFSKVKAPEPSIVDMLHATDTGAATGAATSADTVSAGVNMAALMKNAADLSD